MSSPQHGDHGQELAPFQQFQPDPSPCQPTPNAHTSPSNRTVRFTDDDNPPAPSNPNPKRVQATTVGSKTHLQDFLHDISNRKPDILKPHASHSKSTKSRRPKFFDMHLHESLRLKNIVFLDNLPKALADVFEENLQKLDPSDRHCWVHVPKVWKKAQIRNESDLAGHYQNVLAPKHMAVASKLRFGKHPVFAWQIDPSVPESMTRVVEAIGDGFIHVIPQVITDLSAEDQTNIRLLQEYGLVNVAVWELKSLSCGPKVMQEIPNLEGAFPWKACQERSEHNQVSSRCDSVPKTHRVNGNLVDTGRRTGPDSTLARDIINKATSPEAPNVGSKRVRKEGSLSIPERAAAKRQKPRAKRTTTERRPANAAARSQRIKEAPKSEEEELPKRLPIDDTRDFMQQGWTEAVVEDATFIVFSAGNEEYIGIRDRETQTLYLSRLIKPNEQDNPIYGKIHVGLCIVAYDDAVDRVQTLSKGETPWRWDLNLDKQPVFAARPKVTPDHNLTEAQKAFDANILKSLGKCQAIDIRYHADGYVKKESRKATKAVKPRDRNTWYLKRDESEVYSVKPDYDDDGKDSIDGSKTDAEFGPDSHDDVDSVDSSRTVDYRLRDRALSEALGESDSETSEEELGDLDSETSDNEDQLDDSDGSSESCDTDDSHDFPEPSDGVAPQLYLDFEQVCGKRVYLVYLGQTSAGSSKGKYLSEPLFLKIARENNPRRKNELIREYRNYKELRKPEIKAAVVKAFGLFSYKLRGTDKWYFLIMANGGGTLDEVGESAIPAHAQKYETKYRKALKSFHRKQWLHNNLDSEHMALHPKTKKVKFISLSACARHVGNRFPKGARRDLNAVEAFFNVEESQATTAASQVSVDQSQQVEGFDCDNPWEDLDGI